MENAFIKGLWTNFTETLGTTIIHPQYTVLRFQREAIIEAKRYAKGKLIDIGCGRMPYRKELEPLVESYIGVDHPNVSKLYSGGYKPEVLANAKKLPFKNNMFDIALLLQVLEHVDDPGKVVKEAARVLKPNGVLIISIPFFYPLHDMPYDFGRYTKTALKSFIDGAHLRIIKIETQGGFFEFWLQMLNTFLIKRINDMFKNLNLPTIILLIPTIILAVPLILVNNFLILIIKRLSQVVPRYPDYFPLDYLVVARKK
ncbi:hypothetical protein A2769_01355 [Candidatus Daviesbacteria bacterium RIFCSPHIGHO2_01_FULL_37_27]|nr:MAG: hypothetical protein A2769_01355 [Candidatus Daviesbacteria bacterium RIFCSPHIGHO2_01_FULL_37_27]